MALRPCRECRARVASDAKVCPHCGAPKPVPSYAGPVLLVVGIAVMAYLFERAPAEPRTPRTEHPRSGPAQLARTAIVWRDRAAYDRGVALVTAGAHEGNPELIAPLMACLASGGSQVTVITAGLAWREVVVTDGPETDCQGYVAMEAVVPAVP